MVGFKALRLRGPLSDFGDLDSTSIEGSIGTPYKSTG